MRSIVEQFHELYYNSNVWYNTRWLGIETLKCPLDLWMYQELIHDVHPDLIVECGTALGGAAFYMASICDLLGHGEIITIDVLERENRPAHPRIEYWTGSSTAPATIDKIEARVQNSQTVLVILDSDHSKEHVLQELRIYQRFVKPGSYLIVEDSNVNGHPVMQLHGPGPKEALDVFLRETKDFVVDKECEKFFLTFNPNGFLKRVR